MSTHQLFDRPILRSFLGEIRLGFGGRSIIATLKVYLGGLVLLAGAAAAAGALGGQSLAAQITPIAALAIASALSALALADESDSHASGGDLTKQPRIQMRSDTNSSQTQLLAPANVPASAHREKPRVLIVDDEAGPRESLRFILQDKFDVTAVNSGAKALQNLQTQQFEVVLLDLMMPGDTHGTDTLRALRTINKNLQVIVVSGQGAIEPILTCINLGVYQYIRKPYSRVEIVDAVSSAVSEDSRRRSTAHDFTEVVESLSRELRAPLKAIADYSHVIGKGWQIPLQEHSIMKEAQWQTELSLVYWNNVLSLGSLDPEDLEHTFQHPPFRSLLEQTTRLLERPEIGTHLAVHVPDHLSWRRDAVHLSQFLSVLMLEAAEEKWEALELDTRDQGRMIQFTIRHRAKHYRDTFSQPSTLKQFTSVAIAHACSVLGAKIERYVDADGALCVVLTAPGSIDQVQ